MTPCPRCGQPNTPGAMVCVRCGVALAAPAPYPPTVQAPVNDQVPPWLRPAAPVPQGQVIGSQALQPPQGQVIGSQILQPPQGQVIGSQTLQPPQPGAFPNQFNQGFGAPSAPLAQPSFQGQGQLPAQSLMSDDALPEWLRNASANMPPAPAAPWQQQAPAWGAPQQPPAWQQNPYAQQPQPERPQAGQMPMQRQVSGPLFDESALPDWLRQAARGQEMDSQQQAAPSFAQPAPPQQASWQQPAGQAFQSESPAFPGIDQAGQFGLSAQPNTGVNAASLLDQSALPTWLGGQSNTAQTPSVNSDDLGAMRARSLLEDSALPQWLRAEPDTSGPLAPPPPPAATTDNRGWMAPAAAVEQPPSWLHQVYTDANVQPLAPRAPEPSASAWSGASVYGNQQVVGQAAPTASDRLSAADFVDDAALPDWLRAQGAVAPASEQPQPQSSMGQSERVSPLYQPSTLAYGNMDVGAEPTTKQPALTPDPLPGNPPAHFSASDLIDPSALPAWAMEQSGAPQPEFNSTTGWTSKLPSSRPVPQSSGYGAGASFGRPAESGALASGWDPSPERYAQAPDQFSESSAVSGNLPPWFSPAQQPSRAPGAARAAMQGNGWGRDVPARGADEFGSPGPVSQRGRRRGPPIPAEELPPWLQGTQNSGPSRGAAEPQGWQRPGPGRRMSPDGEWDGMSRRPRDGFPGQTSHDPEEKGRGWRRFFGRR